MCGIAGFINDKKDKKKIIKDMTDKIIHRGPDAEGFYIDDNIALGHRRLSIIDLKGGDQPIYNEDKSIVIIFNGEIYNYAQLKAELKKKKHKFTTKTDTEVLANLIDYYYKNNGVDRALYLLALIDYLSRINNKDINKSRYNALRQLKLDKPLFVGGDSLSFDSVEQAEKELDITVIPEFKKYNIIEENVFNVA